MNDHEWSIKIDQKMLSVLSRHYIQLPIDAVTRQYCLDFCIDQIYRHNDQSSRTFPESAVVLKQYNALCFLSLHDDDTNIKACVLGRGNNVIEGMEDAIKNVSKHSVYRYRRLKLKISLCFLFNEHVTTAASIRIGIHALCIQRHEKIAFFKNSIPINNNFDITTTLIKLSEKAGLDKNEYLDSATVLYRYDTLEFSADSNGDLCDLYRGNPLILQSEINVDLIKLALNNAINCLTGAITSSGEIVHIFCVTRKQKILMNSLSAYTRNIASIWQLITVVRNDRQLNYHECSKNAIKQIISQYFIYEENCGYLLVDGKTHLGIASFLLLTILSFDDEKCFLRERKLLITHIEYKLFEYKQFFSFENDEELLYVGEALFALVTLFEQSKEEKYLKIVESFFPIYRNIYRKTDKKIMMCLWFSKTYVKLYFLFPNRLYADFIFEMNDYLLSYQIPAGFLEVDVTGAFSERGDSTVTATFTESLLEAYSVAKHINDQNRCKKYRVAILLGLRALLQLQLTQDNCSYIPAIGGFKNNVFDNTVRIDNVQHAIGALKKAIELEIF